MQLTRKGKEKGIEAVSGRIVVIKKRKGKKGKRKKRVCRRSSNSHFGNRLEVK
jgi:hypothetical protein